MMQRNHRRQKPEGNTVITTDGETMIFTTQFSKDAGDILENKITVE